jgi:alcohol dehydrogenase, propanol-preferring
MKAYQLVAWQEPAELRDVDVPDAGPGEILIKVGGAGACHSDLHLLEWPAGMMPYELPFTLGHENAGWIESLGSGVRGWELGEPVAVYGPWGCGRCSACRQTLETLCERAGPTGPGGGGLGRDGGMAEYMIVPDSRLLVPLGDLQPRDAAPLSDAALTPYHAIKLSQRHLAPGGTAMVIGIGGLGHMAIQLLRAVSSVDVVAVDISSDKLELAEAVGALATVQMGDDAAQQIRDLTRGQGADLILDCVGNDATMALAAATGRAGGSIMLIGVGNGTMPVTMGAVPFDASVTIPLWGSINELIEVLDLARRGHIRPHVEHYPLERVDEVYQRMRDGQLVGRAVIDPTAS